MEGESGKEDTIRRGRGREKKEEDTGEKKGSRGKGKWKGGKRGKGKGKGERRGRITLDKASLEGATLEAASEVAAIRFPVDELTEEMLNPGEARPKGFK